MPRRLAIAAATLHLQGRLGHRVHAVQVPLGEQAAMGWIVEQISWTKPGRVSSAERAPPPTVSAPSYMVTARPARANTIAALKPFGPDPMTIARFFAEAVNVRYFRRDADETVG